MIRYSVHPSDEIFVKGYSFMPFAKNIGKKIGWSIDLSRKYSQKPVVHAKKSATEALKTASKKEILKLAVATGDLIGNKISNKITKVSKNSSQNILPQLKVKEKYLKKDIYLQTKDRKLHMI